MPEPSRIYGIVVRMYFDDDQQHSLPHIHAYDGSMDASYSLQENGLAVRFRQSRRSCFWLGWPFTSKNYMKTGIWPIAPANAIAFRL